jgi:hypothetical protein
VPNTSDDILAALFENGITRGDIPRSTLHESTVVPLPKRLADDEYTLKYKNIPCIAGWLEREVFASFQASKQSFVEYN